MALAAIATNGVAWGAGYAIKEQSASALGNAFAGSSAAAEDISYMFFNPAGLTRQEGSQVLSTASAIVVRSTFNGGRASTINGTPITGGDGGDDVTEDVVVPSLYALWDLDQTWSTGYDLRLGLGVNVPFGLETDYNSGWVGRYQALHSKLATVNVNPVIAFRPIPWVSLGGGLQLQYADARLTNAIDFGSIGAASGFPDAVPTSQDGLAKVSGDDLGYGYNAGVLIEPWEGTRLGAAFRSAIDHTLKGDGSFRLDSAGIGQAVSTATGAFVDTDAKADVTTPETLTFGLYHDIDRQWALVGEATWTNWSRFDELRIEFDNAAQPDSVTEENWKDTWFLAVGVTYRPVEDWTLRLGIARDNEPIPNDHRTPRIPGNDRTWLSVGASYQPWPSMTFSMGYTHIFLEDASVDLKATDTGSTFRGNLSGESDTSIDIIALQASFVF